MRDLPAGFTKVPFGFSQDDKGLVAMTSVKTRNERSELGEFAIELFASLGVSDFKLLELKSKPNPTNGLRLLSGVIEFNPELKEG
jgi:hypothetical protein